MSGRAENGFAGRALITGASSGIGREIARICARHGHDLVINARDATRLRELAGELEEQHGVNVRVLPKDLSRESAPDEIYQTLQEDGLEIDILVNNAGFDVLGPFHRTPGEKERAMIQVNLVALTKLTRLFLPAMVERESGRIMNIGSIGSYIPSPLNAIYSATKAYVLSFSEAISMELKGTGVTVTTLCPGVTRTEFHDRADMEDIRLLRFGRMDAEAVAEQGYRAMMQGKRTKIPGLMAKFQVLLGRFAPRSLLLRMGKFMLEG